MADKDKNQTPPQEQEQEQEQATQAPPQEQAPAQSQDHSSLIDALKTAFGTRTPLTEVKKGMDETIPGGKYIRFDQLVNANGEPIDERGKVVRKD